MLVLEEAPWVFWLVQIPILAVYVLTLRRRPRAWRSEGVAFLRAAAAFLVVYVALLALGMDGFGHVHLAFATGVLTLPVVLLVSSRFGGARRARGPVRLLAALILGVGLYAWFVEPLLLVREETRVEGPLARELVIGVLSDLQAEGIGAKERRAVDEILSANPDLILLPGDVFHAPSDEWVEHHEELAALLGRLRAPLGVYAVTGDVDVRSRFGPLMHDAGIRWLDREVATLEHGGERIALVGIPVHTTRPQMSSVLRDARREPTDATILLSHRPGAVLKLPPDHGVDLVVAGHTHGGQIAVPFFGPPVTASVLPRRIGAGGLHELVGTKVYVSRGVGLERGQAPRIRFSVRPEVSILRLQPRPHPSTAPAGAS